MTIVSTKEEYRCARKVEIYHTHAFWKIQGQELLARPTCSKFPCKTALLIKFKFTELFLGDSRETSGISSASYYLSPLCLMVGECIRALSLELCHDFARALPDLFCWQKK